MKRTILYIVLGVVVIAVLISIFRKSEPQYGTKAVVTIPKTEYSQSKVKDVTFIIDNSGSMRGYVDFSGNKEQFKDAKKALLAKTGEFMGNCDSKLHAKTMAICNGKEYNTSQTLSCLSNYSAFSGPITEVQQLIQIASEKAKGDSSLCVVVSDMILSYGKKTLIEKGDRYFNKHSLDDLYISVRNEFKRLCDDGKGVLIAKYEGDFNGNYYYNYTENMEPCKFKDTLMTKRPFYFMVIGKIEALKNLCNNKCLPMDYKEIFSSLKLEDSDKTTEGYTISQPTDQPQWILGCPNVKTEAKAGENVYSVSMTKNLKNAVSQFDFSFDCFEIPTYISSKLTPQFDKTQLESVSALNNNSSFTVTTVPYEKLSKINKVTVHFYSPRYVSYQSSSTDDDSNATLSAMESRTWGFDAVVKALYDAYGIHENDNNYVMSLDFVINAK